MSIEPLKTSEQRRAPFSILADVVLRQASRHAGFATGGGLSRYRISNGGMTATLKADYVGYYGGHFVCQSTSFTQGTGLSSLLSMHKCTNPRGVHVGVHLATFRIDDDGDDGRYGGSSLLGLGVVPVSRISYADGALQVGYVYLSNGTTYVVGWPIAKQGATFGTGDTLTVCLDLDAETVAFRKNGASFNVPGTRRAATTPYCR